MCGIVGAYIFNGVFEPKFVKMMTDSIQHRGPDDEGFLAVDSGSGEVYPLIGSCSKVQGPRIEDFSKPTDLFLGHRRLAILDLSPAGHQPMCNEDGSLWVVFNGEIYNYLEIRIELLSARHRFKSQTDTEVILHAYEEWGTECLKRFNGMWAFAILDVQKKTIFCSRDRAGVKPFYYTYDGKRFCFASEIKALLELDGFEIEPNEQIIADYLFFGLLDHTNETFFKNIYQLRPGESLLIEGNRMTTKTYWDIELHEANFSQESDYSARFYELLEDSIRLRLRTDVPIGSCLSGGLDSSSIVCLANKLMFDGENIDPKLVGERQKTFSSCFEELPYDERKFIELVIRQTGAEKNYVFPQAENLYKDLSKLIWHQEEPFGSTSIYAQWKVMELVKKQEVKVLLDGQGGDELLAGYPSSFYYLFGHSLKRGKLGHLLREMNGFRKNLFCLPNQLVFKILTVVLPTWMNLFAQPWAKKGMEWAELGFQKNYFRNYSRPKKFEHELSNYLYHIFRFNTLPGLLHYEDRNSMAFSIETRLPFLDFRLIEYIFSLPFDQKIKNGITKVVLRNAMKNILPEEIRNRRDKMGFATPQDVWFRTFLRNPIKEIIHSKSFAERGYFDIDKVKKAFDKHCEGKTNISFMIWRWVNLELWLRTFLDKNPSSQGGWVNGN